MSVIKGFEKEWERLSKHIVQDVEPTMSSLDGAVVAFNFTDKGKEFTGATHNGYAYTPHLKPDGYLYTVTVVSKDSNVRYNAYVHDGDTTSADLDKF